MDKEEITVSMLKAYSEVAPFVLLWDNKRYYAGMKDFDGYQVEGETYYRNRKTKETYKLTATIERVGKTEVVVGKDFTELRKIDNKALSF